MEELPLVEKLLLESAFRRRQHRLIKLLLEGREWELPDIYWTLAALRLALSERRFQSFPTAWRLVERLQGDLQSAVLSKQEEQRLVAVLKIMYILAQVGKDTTKNIIDLVERHLVEETALSNIPPSDKEVMERNAMDRLFADTRKYVLEVLARRDRTEHFVAKKFPTSFGDALETIDRLAGKLINKNWDRIPLPVLMQVEMGLELEAVFRGKEEWLTEAGVRLYLVEFAGRVPTEDEVIRFVGRLRSQELSLTPPDFSALTRPAGDAVELEEGAGAAGKAVPNGSDDLFASNEGEEREPRLSSPSEAEAAATEKDTGAARTRCHSYNKRLPPYSCSLSRPPAPCQVKLVRIEDDPILRLRSRPRKPPYDTRSASK